MSDQEHILEAREAPERGPAAHSDSEKSEESVPDQVPPGYKRTDVGVIPEDWEVRTLRDLSSMKSGEPITSARIDETLPYPCYGGNGLRGFTSRYTHDGEYVLIGRQGALCGNVVRVSDQFYASEHAVVTTAKRGVNIDWLSYVLGTIQLNRLSESSAQPGLSVQKVLNLQTGVPASEYEQRAIATALSDADALIDSLDRLIAKKRAIKQAAMQQLLTGQARLPGFYGEWEDIRLGDYVEIAGGGTPSSYVPEYWNGGIPWCTPTDITSSPGKYIKQTERSISDEGLRRSAAILLPKGALLVCTRATIGELKLAARPICTNQGFKSLVCNPGIYNEFLYYKLLTMKQILIDRSSGSTFLEISKKGISDLEITVPSIDEQRAIASALSDLDAEIEA
ncbi:MAG: restriction endonuclease subunit S, partial [Desulfosalsimonas sp.]